jgi:hypothetical protein
MAQTQQLIMVLGVVEQALVEQVLQMVAQVLHPLLAAQ